MSDIAIRNQQQALPYDAEVEWIYGDGRISYIKTGYIPPKAGTHVDVEAKFTIDKQDGNVNRPFGQLYKYYAISLEIKPIEAELNGGFRWLGDGSICKIIPRQGHIYSVKTYDGKFEVIDETEQKSQVVSASNVTNNVTDQLILFSVGRSVSPIIGKMFYFKLWEEGVLKFDMIPVRVKNAGAMYDRVSKKLFMSAGSSKFTAGSDK